MRVCEATLAFIKTCNVLSAIIEMADFREQHACRKFCFKLGETATECYEMLKTAFGEPKLNPVNGKVRGHLDRRRQGKWEQTSSQCWFVSLIRRELFTKNLFLLVKQLMLHSTSKFWNVYRRMREGSDLISGGTTHGRSTMTMRQPMLLSWLDGFWPITIWLWCHILLTQPCAQWLFFISKTENEA